MMTGGVDSLHPLDNGTQAETDGSRCCTACTGHVFMATINKWPTEKDNYINKVSKRVFPVFSITLSFIF